MSCTSASAEVSEVKGRLWNTVAIDCLCGEIVQLCEGIRNVSV